MKNFKQGTISFNAFTLKLIAIIGMTLNHASITFSDNISQITKIALFPLGGTTFPIMAFLLVEGYRYTSNFKLYAQRLLLFAILAQGPYMWAMRFRSLNVMFTLLLGLVTLYLYDNMEKRKLFWLAFVGLALITSIMDWGVIGILIILLYHVIQVKWKRFVIPILLPVVFVIGELCVYAIVPSISLDDKIHRFTFGVIGCGLTIPLLMKYNEQRGRTLKYLFYFFYPVHLLILALIRGALFQDWVFVWWR